jgi:hypothetical protein
MTITGHVPPFDTVDNEYDQSFDLNYTSAEVVDLVNAPPHYRQGDIECIDAIKAALTPEEFRGYCKGNAIKYVWRERHKGGNESMAKADYYLKKAQE